MEITRKTDPTESPSGDEVPHLGGLFLSWALGKDALRIGVRPRYNFEMSGQKNTDTALE